MAPREGVETSGGERSQADRATMREIAERTGGDLRELDEMLGLAVEFQRLRQSAFDEGSDRAPVERFQWFLGGALALLGLQALVAEGGWRRRLRGGRVALGAALLPLAALIVGCGSAEYRHVEDGNSAYADGRYDEALSAYRDAAELAPEAPELPYNVGNALHQLGRYEEATVASTEAMNAAADPLLFARATYALGSHAFERGDLEAAREAWISVLLRDPDDRDAKHNLELTLRLLAGDPLQPDPVTPRGGEGDDGFDGSGEAPDGDQSDAAANQPIAPDPTLDEDGQRPDAQDPDASGSEDAPPGRPSGPPAATLEDAQSRLSEALLELGDEALSLDDAISILDLVRIASELEALEPRPGGGGLADR